MFAERFKQATTTAEKTALATDMMDAAGKVQAGSADQYVLLKIARDVAAATGDAATALQAVERLLEQFDEPGAELIGDTLLTAARQAAGRGDLALSQIAMDCRCSRVTIRTPRRFWPFV